MELGYAAFQGWGATVAFIRLMNSAFDILNSRNPLGKGTEEPMNRDNYQSLRPSDSVVTICMEAERVLQRLLQRLGGKLPQGYGFTQAITTAVLSNTRDMELFPELLQHQFDTAVEDNYIHLLVKRISSYYARIIFYHLRKKYTDTFTG